MRDGVRLAADLWLPGELRAGGRVPAILHQTRYHRATVWGAAARRLGIPELLDVNASLRSSFLRAGYAWVDLDVRGTGASFGSRPCPWWRDEVADGAQVVDWIVAQPWSSGVVGATGVSYGGTCAEFLATNKHPAVKAVAPRFSLFDVFTDVAFPGGVHLHWFTETWARFNQLLDENAYADAVGIMARINLAATRQRAADLGKRRRARLVEQFDSERAQAAIAWLAALANGGVRRVAEGEDGRRLVEAALRDHAANGNVHEAALQIVHRDDAGMSEIEPEATIDVFSPHVYLADLRASGAAIYSYSGWLDGAYQHGAIKRHLNLPRAQSKLILGPWDHGGRQDISPFTPERRTDFDHDAELIRFFDCHLRRVDNGIMEEAPVRYYTLGHERWRTTEEWPPPECRPTSWFLAAGNQLQAQAQEESGCDSYVVDLAAGTGMRSRWRSLVGLAVPLGYGDRAAADRRLLCYTSAALGEDVEVTGHAVVYLYAESTAPDGAVHVYLEDVAPSGRVTLVTEGQLRLLHRRLSDHEPPYRTVVPYRSFTREHAAPLVPGEVAELCFDLLPTSYVFFRGHALRVAIAGTDRDHFAPLVAHAPTLRFHRGGARRARIELPVATR